MSSGRRIALLAAILAAATVPAVRADEAAQFTERVAPLLRQRCVPCHNPQKTRGGLDLTTHEALLRGGNEGPAVVPGRADGSLLVKMIGGNPPRMPKQAAPLAADQVAA